MTATGEPALLWGWGRTAPTTATLVHPSSLEDQVAAVRSADGRGVLARGLGRGYGDCAQNAGGTVVDGPSRSGLLDVDLDTATIRVLDADRVAVENITARNYTSNGFFWTTNIDGYRGSYLKALRKGDYGI